MHRHCSMCACHVSPYSMCTSLSKFRGAQSRDACLGKTCLTAMRFCWHVPAAGDHPCRLVCPRVMCVKRLGQRFQVCRCPLTLRVGDRGGGPATAWSRPRGSARHFEQAHARMWPALPATPPLLCYLRPCCPPPPTPRDQRCWHPPCMGGVWAGRHRRRVAPLWG